RKLIFRTDHGSIRWAVSRTRRGPVRRGAGRLVRAAPGRVLPVVRAVPAPGAAGWRWVAARPAVAPAADPEARPAVAPRSALALRAARSRPWAVRAIAPSRIFSAV